MPKNQKTAGESPLNVGQPSPTVLPSQGINPADKYQVDYDLVVKPNLDEDPRVGQMFLEETVNNQKIAFKTKDLEGKIVRASLDLTNLQNVTAKIVNNKLVQEAINTDKQLILNAIKANTTAKLFKDAEALRAAQQADENAALNKDSKKRREDINKVVQGPSQNQEASHLTQMQHLAGMNAEGIAITMTVEQIAWIFKTICVLQYLEDRYNYNALLEHDREKGARLVYDLTKAKGEPEGPNNKPLYAFDFVGDKVVLDKTRPIEVENVSGKLRLKPDNKPQGFTDSMIIMANGYFPPPDLVTAWKKEFHNHVYKQVGAVLNPQMRAIEANLYNQIEEEKKPKEEVDSDLEKKRETQIAQSMAARPTPKPTTK